MSFTFEGKKARVELVPFIQSTLEIQRVLKLLKYKQVKKINLLFFV